MIRTVYISVTSHSAEGRPVTHASIPVPVEIPDCPQTDLRDYSTKDLLDELHRRLHHNTSDFYGEEP